MIDPVTKQIGEQAGHAAIVVVFQAEAEVPLVTYAPWTPAIESGGASLATTASRQCP